MPKLRPAVRQIFSIFLSTTVVPTFFKATIIIPLPRKSSVSCLSDYRPVPLTPIIMKCFETHKITAAPSIWKFNEEWGGVSGSLNIAWYQPVKELLEIILLYGSTCPDGRCNVFWLFFIQLPCKSCRDMWCLELYQLSGHFRATESVLWLDLPAKVLKAGLHS